MSPAPVGSFKSAKGKATNGWGMFRPMPSLMPLNSNFLCEIRADVPARETFLREAIEPLLLEH